MLFSEFQYYSLLHDREMIRISMVNERNGEFFTYIPADDGRRYRERRDQALGTIQSAIEAGLDPGEVLPV